MTVDSEKDIRGLLRIGQIVAQALEEMKQRVRPGLTTRDLDEIGQEFLERHGAHSAPILVYDFPGTTCISINDEAAHGIPGSRMIQPGDMVNIDISAELDGYFGDTAATVLVPPNSPIQQKLCRCAESALSRAIQSVRAGLPLQVIGQTVERQATQCGFQVIQNLGGHGVGRSIHEEPHFIYNYFNRKDHRVMNDGLVITIEPFLSTGANHVVTGEDGWTLRTPDGSFSAQYEHTLVVRNGAPIITTALNRG